MVADTAISTSITILNCQHYHSPNQHLVVSPLPYQPSLTISPSSKLKPTTKSEFYIVSCVLFTYQLGSDLLISATFCFKTTNNIIIISIFSPHQIIMNPHSRYLSNTLLSTDHGLDDVGTRQLVIQCLLSGTSDAKRRLEGLLRTISFEGHKKWHPPHVLDAIRDQPAYRTIVQQQQQNNNTNNNNQAPPAQQHNNNPNNQAPPAQQPPAQQPPAQQQQQHNNNPNNQAPPAQQPPAQQQQQHNNNNGDNNGDNNRQQRFQDVQRLLGDNQGGNIFNMNNNNFNFHADAFQTGANNFNNTVTIIQGVVSYFCFFLLLIHLLY